MKSIFKPSAAVLAFLCLLYLNACTTSTDGSEKMVGQWYNESLEVRMDAKTGGSTLYEVPKGEWENVLKIRPIQTTYRADGTYGSKYWNLQDSLVREVSGQWEMIGDTLFLTESGVRTGYHITFMDDRARFTAYYDWDSDGEVDDLYKGVQIKK